LVKNYIEQTFQNNKWVIYPVIITGKGMRKLFVQPILPGDAE
jgi:hypothetical protein